MMTNCNNNLLIGDTSIFKSDRIPTIKILDKNNFITKFKLIKKIINNKQTIPPIKGVCWDDVYF
jgi:hypothetical protein